VKDSIQCLIVEDQEVLKDFIEPAHHLQQTTPSVIIWRRLAFMQSEASHGDQLRESRPPPGAFKQGRVRT